MDVRSGRMTTVLRWIVPAAMTAILAPAMAQTSQPEGGWSFPTQTEPAARPLFTTGTTDFVRSQLKPAASEPAFEVLPDGLLYRSYIAGPHEPRFAMASLYDPTIGEWRWDATLGGRVGLLRDNDTDFLNMDRWQVDLEGAVLTRINPEMQLDVESADYRFGLLWTGQQDNVAWKFGYFHVSSHLGDEFLLSNPGFLRLNFVRDSLILGQSVQATPELRYYGEVAWAFSAKGGARPWQFQFGAEHAMQQANPLHGAPFAAVNCQMRQEVEFSPGFTAMTGWQWKGPRSGRTWRVGLQYYDGPSNQYSFFRRSDRQIGMGVWFDY